MGKTISTHNGSAAHRDHNICTLSLVDKQTRIDKTLADRNETIIDKPHREAYQRIFGEALAEYNKGNELTAKYPTTTTTFARTQKNIPSMKWLFRLVTGTTQEYTRPENSGWAKTIRTGRQELKLLPPCSYIIRITAD